MAGAPVDGSQPSLGSHLNPIPTRGNRLCPPYSIYYVLMSSPSFESHRGDCMVFSLIFQNIKAFNRTINLFFSVCNQKNSVPFIM